EATAAAAVRQAIAGYRQQASRFAGRQTACADLARGFSAVDEAWLRYSLASPSAAAGDSLAADVDQVEADFERSGCPRPTRVLLVVLGLVQQQGTPPLRKSELVRHE